MSAARRGQTLVEMSLVTPLLVLMLCVVIEFGWSFYAMATLGNASRIGARVGSARLDQQAIEDAVAAARGHLSQTSVAVTVTTSSGVPVAPTDRTPGNYLQVEVTSPYRTCTGLVDLSTLAGISQFKDRSTFVIGY